MDPLDGSTLSMVIGLEKYRKKMGNANKTTEGKGQKTKVDILEQEEEVVFVTYTIIQSITSSEM